ncbi:hypothetical protein [Deefgea sp. CFH1-16]|uniref:hypothetical protein n=1 Tax=Deefgea sp. CFH1-16 TaxID=2675457 RepID=UPI0035AFCCC1
MSLILACPHCQTKNKLAVERLSEQPQCGACHQPLLSGAPILATNDNLSLLLKHSPWPVVIDFGPLGAGLVRVLGLLLPPVRQRWRGSYCL